VQKINISIDDVSPHPKSSIRVIGQCEKILKRVPGAKFTIFVPTAYWRTIPSPPESLCEGPLRLSLFPDFCRALRDLPADAYEVGFHGHHHGIPGVTNNDELKTLSRDQAADVFSRMIREATEAGLADTFKMILRPPAWRLSPAAFDAAVGIFDVLALHPGDEYLPVYRGRQFNDHWNKRVVFADAVPPLMEKPASWETLEVVFHACEWDRNYLSDQHVDWAVALFEDTCASGSFMGSLRGKV